MTLSIFFVIWFLGMLWQAFDTFRFIPYAVRMRCYGSISTSIAVAGAFIGFVLIMWPVLAVIDVWSWCSIALLKWHIRAVNKHLQTRIRIVEE